MSHVLAPQFHKSANELQEKASCLACGYSLRGLSEARCPECGREFEPSDPRTMLVPGFVGPIARKFLAPYGRTTLALTSIAAVVTVWGGIGLTFILRIAFVMWMALFAIAIVRRIGRLIALFYWRQRSSAWPVGRNIVWRARLIFLATIVLVVLRVPVYIAFWISSPLFEARGNYLYTQVPFDEAREPHFCFAGVYGPARIYATINAVYIEPWGGGQIIYTPDRNAVPRSSCCAEATEQLSDHWFVKVEFFPQLLLHR